MKVACPSCQASLNIDDSKIPAGGARIRCPTCKNIFPHRPGAAAARPDPQTWEEVPTRAVSLPGLATLSAQARQAPQPGEAPAIPLPGSSAPTREVPLPGAAQRSIDGGAWDARTTQEIPLPGAAPGAAASDWDSRATREVPLPGLSTQAEEPTNWDEAPTRAVPLPGLETLRAGPQPIPLPGAAPLAAQSSDRDEEDTHTDPPPWTQHGRPSEPPPVDLAPEALTREVSGGYQSMLESQPPEEEWVRPEAPAEPAETDTTALPEAVDDLGEDITADYRFGGQPLSGAPPGRAHPFHEPFPGGFNASNATPAPSSSIPLPGARSAAPAFPAPPSSSIPLPGAKSAAPAVPAPPSSSIPLPGAAPHSVPELDFRAPVPPSVPLPGPADAFDEDAAGFDIAESPRPQPTLAPDAVEAPGFPPPPPPAPLDFEFTEAAASPSAEEGMGSDFSQTPAPTPTSPAAFEFSSAPPPPPAMDAFDFSAPAAPTAPPSAPDAFDFSQAPAPPPAAAGFDFPEPPSFPSVARMREAAAPPPQPRPPAAPEELDLAFDFSLAPPPLTSTEKRAPEGTDFEARATAVDALEFDPTLPAPAAPKKVPQGTPGFEDSSDPDSSAQAAPSDGLEMLGFIDSAGKEQGVGESKSPPARRLHIKRRSGKVFGPFEEAVVVKMLEDAQLLGNEEVSVDAATWRPIGGEPAFQSVIARLMESPTRAPTKAAVAVVGDALPPQGPSMDRLRQVYEGRMAAVAVVRGRDPISIKKHLPKIVAGGALCAVLGFGVFLGVGTPYGFFGLKVLFPAKVRPGTREHEYLTLARQGLSMDTFKGYATAKAQAQLALDVREFPEARAVWCQAVSYLKRRYGLGSEAELARLADDLPNIKLLGEKHPEVLKALAGDALREKKPDAAMGYVDEALAREENQADTELLFLRAEAQLQKKQLSAAVTDYQQILKRAPKSARALHALGTISRARNELDAAQRHYEQALASDPNHVLSAVELADLAIVGRRDAIAGEPLVAQALAEERKAHLGPSEQARALALQAEILLLEGKPSEALTEFERALKVDPAQTFIKARLAKAHLEMHHPEKAYPLFQEVYAGAQDDLSVVQSYLHTLIALGKMDEATKVVDAAVTRFPTSAPLFFLSGRVADALGKVKDAEAAYKRAIAAQPDNGEAYLALARLHLRFRRNKEALPILQQGIEKAPNYGPLHVGMGELALKERDVALASSEFNRAFELSPSLPEAHLGLSRIALEEGRYEAAAEAANKALALNPRVIGGKLQQGICLWKLKLMDQAVSTLEKAREESPGDLQLTITLGAVKFDNGDLDGALANLTSALGAEPGNAEGNFYLARVKNARAEHSQAIEAMKRALDANAKNSNYRYWLGRVLLDARKPTEAIEEWKVALELDPANADALEAMGRVHYERAAPADLRKAVGFFEKALDSDPSRIQVLSAIGETQMKMENYDAAIATFTRVLETGVKKADQQALFFRLGQCYQEKRRPLSAIEWYRRALEIDPKNADALQSLGYLYKDIRKKSQAVESFTRYLEARPNADNKKEIEDEIYFMKQER